MPPLVAAAGRLAESDMVEVVCYECAASVL